MSDYISREALIKAVEGNPYVTDSVKSYVRCTARSIPAADVRPVVFCKDCRHRDPEDHKCDSGETERQGCPFPVHDDYFCAYGERKEEEEQDNG